MQTATALRQEPRYLTCAETALHVRAALKAAFPTVKFSVRSSTYSGGASIRIGWVDGPRREAVEDVAKGFEGATFDGMTDCKNYHESVLDGQPVHFGADFIFCDGRRLSQETEWVATAKAMVEKRCDFDRHGIFCSSTADEWSWRIARDLDFNEKPLMMERAFRRVVLREKV